MTSVYSHEYKEFLEKLKKARQEAGLTQLQAAEAVGRPQSFISKCESGERRVDIIELAFFSRLYSKPLTYFIADDGEL